MSTCITTMISFPIYRREQLLRAAREHAWDPAEHLTTDTSLAEMLHGIAAGNFVGRGRNGDLCSYGFVGSYVGAEDVIEKLAPFFITCFNTEAISDDDHVVLMLQDEENRIETYEIGLPEQDPLAPPRTSWQVDDLQIRGRVSNFPLWSSDEPIKFFGSWPIHHGIVTKTWEGE